MRQPPPPMRTETAVREHPCTGILYTSEHQINVRPPESAKIWIGITGREEPRE